MGAIHTGLERSPLARTSPPRRSASPAREFAYERARDNLAMLYRDFGYIRALGTFATSDPWRSAPTGVARASFGGGVQGLARDDGVDGR